MNLEPFRTKDISLETYQRKERYYRKIKKIIRSNKKILKAYLLGEQEILAYRKKKMWYGKIVFEIIQHYVYGIPAHQEINIVYIRQLDTPKINDTFLHDFLRKKKWKKTTVNIISLCITILLIVWYICHEIYELYCENFPAIAKRSIVLDFVLKLGFELIFSSTIFLPLPMLAQFNVQLVDLLTQLCINLNLIF